MNLDNKARTDTTKTEKRRRCQLVKKTETFSIPSRKKYVGIEMDIIGLVGLGLIVAGFGYEMLKTIQKKKCEMNRYVLGLFITASILLFYHAYTINDEIFMSLNLVLTGINIVNFYYA